jgi:hypothetical protein
MRGLKSPENKGTPFQGFLMGAKIGKSFEISFFREKVVHLQH